MVNKNNTIVIIAVLVLGLGLYIYSDIQEKNKNPKESPSMASSTTINGVDIQTTGGDFTVNELPVAMKPSIKQPNLDRPIIFLANVTPEVRKIVTENSLKLVEKLKKDSMLTESWISLGLQRKIAGDYEGAREDWEYASAISPSNYISFSNLGDLYTHYLKNYQKAEENFKISIKNKPDNIGGYRMLYELYRYSYKEKSSLAPQILKEGLSKNPQSTDLMILLAQYYKEVGDKEQARSYYNQALNAFNKASNTSMAALIQQELNNL